jgi:DnaD/phage-associated family protein
MASKYWLKLYYEMLDDPKVMTLRPALRWRFIEACLLAGDTDEGGFLPTTRNYAWRVRDSFEVVETELQELAENGLLSRDDGRWLVTKFADRQAADSNTDRWRRFRDRQRKEEYNAEQTPANATQTKRWTDKIREDKDKDTDAAFDAPGGGGGVYAHAFESYENNIGNLTPMLQKKIEASCKANGEQTVIDAIGIAVDNGVRKWNYINGILERWQREGKGSRANGKDNELWQRIMDVTAAGKLGDLQGAEREAARIVGPANLKGTSPEKFKARFLEEYHKCQTR